MQSHSSEYLFKIKYKYFRFVIANNNWKILPTLVLHLHDADIIWWLIIFIHDKHRKTTPVGLHISLILCVWNCCVIDHYDVECVYVVAFLTMDCTYWNSSILMHHTVWPPIDHLLCRWFLLPIYTTIIKETKRMFLPLMMSDFQHKPWNQPNHSTSSLRR